MSNMKNKKISLFMPEGIKRLTTLSSTILLSVVLIIATLCDYGLADAACANTPDPNQGTDSLTFNAPLTGTYTVWTRILAPDASDNSVYMQIGPSGGALGCAANVGGGSAITPNAWTWVNYQDGNSSSTITESLVGGQTYNVLLTGNAPGVSIDRILFLSDPTCTPTATGTNCAPLTDNPPAISLTSPTSGATVSGSTVALSADASDSDTSSTLSNVAFSVDGTLVGTDSSYPYNLNWNSTTVSDGSHTLSATATDSDGLTSTTSQTFSVANHTCASGPSAPTLSGSSSSPTGSSLSWTASTAASGCTLSNYSVYRGTTDLGNVTGTTFTDSGLTPNTIYAYKVIANDNAGHSTNSNIANVTTEADTTIPSAPTNVVATAPSSNTVDLSWTASTDNVAVAGYRIYRNGTLITPSSGVTGTTYVDNVNVQANTGYDYQVAAIDSSNNQSNLTNASPYPITTPKSQSSNPPNAPTGLLASLVTSNSVSLSWNASTDSSGSVAGYYVYKNGTQIANVTSGTAYTDSSLSANTSYTYSVAAYDGSGNVSTSNPSVSPKTLAGSSVPGDLNQDGKVNYLDAAILFNHWGQTGQSILQGNIINSSTVHINYQDAAILFDNWTTN
jgi:chitodextrinase